MALLAASGIRRFVLEARLTGFPLREVDDEKLRQLIRQAITDRRLLALRKGEGAGKATSKTVEQRRLVRQIEQQTRDQLAYGGRRYKLVVDVDLAKEPGRNNYDVVGHDEARRVLDGLAKQAGTAGDLATLLGQASAKVSPDWRPPITAPDGLILLRRNLAPAATAPNDEPALTPSQLLGQVEQVHPMLDGTMVELDLSEVDLPTEPDASEPSDGAEKSEDSETPSETAGAEESGESPHGR